VLGRGSRDDATTYLYVLEHDHLTGTVRVVDGGTTAADGAGGQA
jgi:hypothetical protein